MDRFNGFYDYRKHGITQSLLQTWMSCRQKAQWAMQGWSPKKQSESMTYGTIVHGVLEKVYDMVRTKKLTGVPDKAHICKITASIEREFKNENPGLNKKSLDQLDEALLIAEATLPLYFKHYGKRDFQELKWRSLEQEFKVSYVLPDGRRTFIRGKKDGVYGIEKIKLFETKTKSRIDLDSLSEILWFEFQVNLYLWAIMRTYKKLPAGALYNIIRRTNLKRKVNESKFEFAKRVANDIRERPEFYFMRLDIAVTQKEMDKFRSELLRVVREFIDWCEGKLATYKNTTMCEDKHGRCQYWELCSKKNFSAYAKREKVFNELEAL